MPPAYYTPLEQLSLWRTLVWPWWKQASAHTNINLSLELVRGSSCVGGKGSQKFCFWIVVGLQELQQNSKGSTWLFSLSLRSLWKEGKLSYFSAPFDALNRFIMMCVLNGVSSQKVMAIGWIPKWGWLTHLWLSGMIMSKWVQVFFK